MKILAVMPSLHDGNPGGIQVSGEIAWEALRENMDARLFEVPSGNRMAAIRAARAIRFDCDVVLFWHLDLLKLAPLLRVPGRRVVYLHGIEAWRRPGLLTRKLLRGCTLFANSKHTVKRAGRCLPELLTRDATIVPLGIGEPSGMHVEPSRVPAAVMISRLDSRERYKGHQEVICAWPYVRRQIADAQLWIVGDGDLRPELETLVSHLGLNDAVRFFGRVSESEKDRLIHAARCMALPSRGEGFGLVYLEAMRVGRPCIAGFDAGREVIGPPAGGIAVDPSDMGSITDALIRMLTYGAEWQRVSASARRRYEQQFTAAHFQERLLRAIRELH